MSTTELLRQSGIDLELERVLRAARRHCRSDLGTRIASARPALDERESVARELDRVSELRQLLDADNAPPLSGICDIHPLCDQIGRDAVLEPEEYVIIGETLRAAHLLQRYFSAVAEIAPLSAEIAANLNDLEDLAAYLLDTFTANGEIADSASETLATLRQREISMRATIRVEMERLATSPTLEPLLQDNYFTVREDRYVLPLKSSFKPQMDGIIYGSSQTGQTVYIEPAEMIQKNNKLKMLRYEIVAEEYRILRELTHQVKLDLQRVRDNLPLLGELDWLQARARFAIEIGATAPQLSEADLVLLGARNPLLMLQGATVISNDIVIDAEYRILIVSGPNSGGKTITLCTVGLCALMVKHGLHLPVAPDSRIPVYPQVLTVMGDLQNIDSHLSTFTGHVRKLSQLLDCTDGQSLVLIDEIAIGTEPGQGAALAMALLESFADLGATGIVTTHYEPLKTLSLRDQRFMNASVGMDPETLKPTFRLEIGSPGESKPLQIAEMIGLDKRIIERAKALLGNSEESLQQALRSLKAREQQLQELAEQQRVALQQAEDERQRLAGERRQIERTAARLIEEECATTMDELRKLAEEIRERTRSVQQEHRPAELQQHRRRVRAIEEHLSQISDQQPAAPALELAALQNGAIVHLSSMGADGRVLDVDHARKRAVVEVGNLRVNARFAELGAPRGIPAPTPRSSKRAKAAPSDSSLLDHARPLTDLPLQTKSNTLDLRGQRADDALEELDRWLDQCLVNGIGVAFVIHGHGTGALKTAVRDYLLRTNRDHRPGGRGEGGDGVTLISLG